ncbi:hypothetical protein [Paraburkholderia sp. DGU8]|uniref:hypothetical protein n=1 Tax=Paraburkholderia sp. DGU8 TaxID=3161997 RepID=UPI00346637CC
MALENLRYDSVYGSFEHAELRGDATQAVRTSVERYLALLDGRFPETHCVRLYSGWRDASIAPQMFTTIPANYRIHRLNSPARPAGRSSAVDRQLTAGGSQCSLPERCRRPAVGFA